MNSRVIPEAALLSISPPVLLPRPPHPALAPPKFNVSEGTADKKICIFLLTSFGVILDEKKNNIMPEQNCKLKDT